MLRYALILLAVLTFFSCQDKEAPSISINAPSPEVTYSRTMKVPVNVVFYGAYDIHTIDYFLTEQIKGSLDVSELTPSFLVVNDEFVVVDLEPGEYELEFSATDDSGNMNSATTTLILTE